MPFCADYFQENVTQIVQGSAKEKLLAALEAYRAAATQRQKAVAIQNLMELVDREVKEETGRQIMEACGRRCIGDSILKMALQLKKRSANLDDLLALLNEARIGGGKLRREGKVIYAEYHRCYCGSVSKTRSRFSSTYCSCSCGWFKQLFEGILNKPVTVELLGSIIQGHSHCRFRIRLT